MTDRILNVLTLAILAAALAAIAVNLTASWKHVEVWEQEWKPFPTKEVNEGPGRVLEAIRNARDIGADADAATLERHLRDNYRPSGNVKVRITASEWLSTLLRALASLAFLTVPVVVNYVRHGVFRLWNRGGTRSP